MPESTTQTLGIIGDPISHSLSPTLHGHLIKRLDLDFCYHAFRVPSDGLRAAIEGVRGLGIRGLNVTVPHKENVIPFLDTLDQRSREIGAVNTIENRDGKLIGYNTDVSGFLESLRHEGIELEGRRAAIIGAGGSARAVVAALISAGVVYIQLFNRTRNRALALARHFAERTGFQHFSVGNLNADGPSDDLKEVDILVNATALGMATLVGRSPVSERHLRPEMVVFDLIYNPEKTRLLEMAEEAGARAIGGLPMLIFQGVASLRIWTGADLDVSEYFNDLEKRLRKQLQS